MSALQIRTEQITKIIPARVRLTILQFAFDSGRVHALVGKNGSGKSTLVKIFAGAQNPPQESSILTMRNSISIPPLRPMRKGLSRVYQEMSLVPGLSVAENIFLGRLPKKNNAIDWRKTYQMAGEPAATNESEYQPA